jgi:hypothetical protein
MTAMTDDAWQAHATREAAKDIGRWLGGRACISPSPLSVWASWKAWQSLRSAGSWCWRWSGSQAAGGHRGTGRAPLPGLCAICSRESRGFGYTRELRFDHYPQLSLLLDALPRRRLGAHRKGQRHDGKTDNRYAARSHSLSAAQDNPVRIRRVEHHAEARPGPRRDKEAP